MNNRRRLVDPDQTGPFNWALAIAIFAIAVVMTWVTWVAYLIPAHDRPLLGGFFLAIGLFQIVTGRAIGSRHWKKGSAYRKPIGTYWIKLGERGAQLSYLVLGLLVAGSGLFVIGQALFQSIL